mmetsp:Transcript_45053/g.134476  ORF Transcript_45053/g.134476 Transcript_45053/m.134476 type:complete len:216 (-) Transcript_45053:57-704(-)
MLVGQVLRALLHHLGHVLDVQLAVGLVLACQPRDRLRRLREQRFVVAVHKARHDVGKRVDLGKASVSLDLRLKELEEGLSRTCALVVLGVLLGGCLATGHVLDGGEAAHAITLAQRPVGISVNLGNYDAGRQLGVGGDKLAELLVLGREPLAVAAPWSIELHDGVLGPIDEGVVVVGRQVLHARKRHCGVVICESNADRTQQHERRNREHAQHIG